jgi:hypothetical protein
LLLHGQHLHLPSQPVNQLLLLLPPIALQLLLLPQRRRLIAAARPAQSLPLHALVLHCLPHHLNQRSDLWVLHPPAHHLITGILTNLLDRLHSTAWRSTASCQQ